jgi:hypothetical protein
MPVPLEGDQMHGATIWLELAERARTRADDIRDPAERIAALAIVADYETRARDVGPGAGSAWFSAASPSRVW